MPGAGVPAGHFVCCGGTRGWSSGFHYFSWFALGSPTELDIPTFKGFNFTGGLALSPEFLALLLGLTLYIAAFIAEIVRAGIQSIDRGQIEAARSVGLGRIDLYMKVILPQALRVIVPPATAQYVSLTKNSSLGVAIGYPELFNVNNTITTLRRQHHRMHRHHDGGLSEHLVYHLRDHEPL